MKSFKYIFVIFFILLFFLLFFDRLVKTTFSACNFNPCNAYPNPCPNQSCSINTTTCKAECSKNEPGGPDPNAGACLAGFCTGASGVANSGAECQNFGGVWTTTCCDKSNAGSPTYNRNNGFCGDIKTTCYSTQHPAGYCQNRCSYDAGGGNWQEAACTVLTTPSCVSTSINGSAGGTATVSPDGQVTLSSRTGGGTPTNYYYALYNMNNLNSANIPEPVKDANCQKVILNGTTASITATYAQLFPADDYTPRCEGTGNPIPVGRIQINGYFANSAGSSHSHPNCVVWANAAEPPSPKSCSLSISGTTVSFSGSNAPAGNNVKLWLARQDKTAINPPPANQDVYTEGAPLNYTGYLVDSCDTNAQGTCSKTYTIPGSLPNGDYYFHCDIQNTPDKCSGQPLCDYEKPSRPGGKDCAALGYRSCSNNDNAAYTASAAVPGCECNATTSECANVCPVNQATNKFSDVTYTNPIKCAKGSGIAGPTPSANEKNAYCNRPSRPKGDANGDGVVDTNDYVIYLRAVLGAPIAPSDNPDFNGDSLVSPEDLVIWKHAR